MAWVKTVPTSATYLISIPLVFTRNWTVLENIQGMQHYTYTSSLSGRHKPGITPVIYVNSSANIASLTSPQTGAIAFDTDIGAMYRYTGSAWTQMNLDPYPETSAYISSGAGDQEVASAAAGTYTVIEFDSEDWDPLDNYGTLDFKWTAGIAGYYLFTTQLTTTATEANIVSDSIISHYDSDDTLLNVVGHGQLLMSPSQTSITVSAILSMAAGDYAQVMFWHSSSDSQPIESGSDLTFLKVYRLS